jgi:tryptophan-rich sensory protein
VNAMTITIKAGWLALGIVWLALAALTAATGSRLWQAYQRRQGARGQTAEPATWERMRRTALIIFLGLAAVNLLFAVL